VDIRFGYCTELIIAKTAAVQPICSGYMAASATAWVVVEDDEVFKTTPIPTSRNISQEHFATVNSRP
jgi:hypothetical protein